MAGCERRNPYSDRISNLPENVIEKILGRFAIQDLVRTSVLSRNWRYKWTTLPDLVFDDLTLPSQIHDDENKLVGLIYNILLHHNGPICKFSLSIKSMSETNYSHINRWIERYLLGDGSFREFILEFTNGSRYEIPCSLFSCFNLRKLKLQCCIFPSPLPTLFNGFKDLTDLDLGRVTFTNEGFENLIAKCPQLSVLKLRLIDGIDRLNIHHAPKLKILCFHAKRINFIRLEYTPNLTQLKLCCNQLPDMNQNVGNEESTSLTNNQNSLSNLKMFVLGSYFLKSLSQYRLPSTFYHLSQVGFFELRFQDMDSVSSALDLIKRCPNIRNLLVATALDTKSSAAAQLETVTKCLEERSGSIGSLNKLRFFTMKKMIGLKTEMQFIKMILCNSPLLKKIEIQRDQSVYIGGEDEILKELLQLPRASAMAKII